jgi:hypothetical protein
MIRAALEIKRCSHNMNVTTSLIAVGGALSDRGVNLSEAIFRRDLVVSMVFLYVLTKAMQFGH